MSKDMSKLGAALKREDSSLDAPSREDPLVELARIVSGGPLYPRRDDEARRSVDAATPRPDEPVPGLGDDAISDDDLAAEFYDEVGQHAHDIPEFDTTDVFAGDVTAGLERELFAEFDPEADPYGEPEPFDEPMAVERAQDPALEADEPILDETFDAIDDDVAEAPEAPIADPAPVTARPAPFDVSAILSGLTGASATSAAASTDDRSTEQDGSSGGLELRGGSAALLDGLRRNFSTTTTTVAVPAPETRADAPDEQADFDGAPVDDAYEADMAADDAPQDLDTDPGAPVEAADDVVDGDAFDLALQDALGEALVEDDGVAEAAPEMLSGAGPRFVAEYDTDVADHVDDGSDYDDSAWATAPAIDETEDEAALADGFDAGVDVDLPSLDDEIAASLEAAVDGSLDLAPAHDDDDVDAGDSGLGAVEAALLGDLDLGDTAEPMEPAFEADMLDAPEMDEAEAEPDFDVVPDGFAAETAEDLSDDAVEPVYHSSYADDYDDVDEPPRVAIDLDEAYAASTQQVADDVDPYAAEYYDEAAEGYEHGHEHAAYAGEAGYAEQPEYAEYDEGYDDGNAVYADAADYRDPDVIAVAADEAQPLFDDDEEALPPHPHDEMVASPAEKPASRGMLVAAVIAGTVVTGLAGFFGYRYLAGDAPSGPPPLIAADKSPVKVQPDPQEQTAEASRSKLIYDRVGGGAEGGEERLVIRSEEPVTSVTGADVAGQEGATSTPERATRALPRRVRTVVVRPDGTIVEAPAGEAEEGVAIRTTNSEIDTASSGTDAASGEDVAAGSPLPTNVPRVKPDAEADTTDVAETADETAVVAEAAETAESADAESTVVAEAPASAAPAPEETTADAAADTPVPLPTTTAEKPEPRKISTARKKVKTEPIVAPTRNAPVPAARPAPTEDVAPAAPVETRTVTTEPVSAPVRPVTPTGTPQQTARAASHAGPLDLTGTGTAPAASTAGAAPAAAAPPPAGTYSVQVSSQRSEAQAQEAYKALERKHPNLFSSQNAMILKADLGTKGTYYRVRVGPMERAAADNFCSNLKQRGGDCFVRRN